MLFQGKKDAFLRNTANKHHVIIVILTEPKKPRCNVFHSYDPDIDITKLRVQSFLRCLLITEISESKDVLVLLFYHTYHNSKPLYFQSIIYKGYLVYFLASVLKKFSLKNLFYFFLKKPDLKKFLIFPEMELSYISGKEYSEP